MVSQTHWRALSELFGWGYFVMWTFSMYPQICKNYYFRSVEGFSIDYATINPMGYFAYVIYNIQGSISNGKIGDTGQIDLNDVFYAVHGFACSLVIFVQTIIYERGKSVGSRWKRWSLAFVIAEFCILTAFFVMETWGWRAFRQTYAANVGPDFLAPHLSFVRMCGYIKALTSFVKYIP